MKKLFLALSLTILSVCAVKAQNGYEFTVVKQNPITSIKNQNNTGTCWSFSGVGFLESELIKAGKGEHDLSEMYIVRRNYKDQGEKFVRLNGSLNFSQGGSFADVIETLDEYGVIPQEHYEGLNYGEDKHIHGELSEVLTAYVKAVILNKNGRLSTAWQNGMDGILDAYLGVVPTHFKYKGKDYTPQSFAKKLGLKSENYISLTSFTHHPFYAPFAVEVPDNWRWALSYNLPIDDLIKVMDNAIENGYTIAWASDVSEVGFTRDGVGVIPDQTAQENIGSDQAHWLGLSPTQKTNELRKKISEGPVKELTITQEMRQKAFDNYETTDDHGMQIFGIAKDQNGNKYYMVKNSWGESGKYKGIWYVSEAFVRYKTMDIFVNKDALPKNIKKMLNY